METRSMKKLREMKRKNEDLISNLPDAIIQHIQSFLPSTEEVIQTSVLSKRWRNHVRSLKNSLSKLEELYLVGYLDFKTVRLLNLPSSLCATLDFYHPEQKTCKGLIIEILQQLQYLKELKIGSWILQVLSTIKVGGQFSPMLNIKSLTLNSPSLVEYHYGIAHLLHISPVLEKLVINDPQYFTVNTTNIGKKYWDSNADVFDCLVSHLKTIKIMGFPKEVNRREHMLNLVKFVLKNARVLEKMVVLLGHRIGTSQSDLSQILLSLPRCSQYAIIEVL